MSLMGTREVRMCERLRDYAEEVSYVSPRAARERAFEIGRFYKAEGHKVTVVRSRGYYLLTVWDITETPGLVGGMLFSMDVREWD